MINPSLRISDLKERYSLHRRIVIDNFLEPSLAKEVYRSFEDLTRFNLWYQVSYGNPRYFDPRGGKQTAREHFSYRYEKFPICNVTLPKLIDADSRRSHLGRVSRIASHPERELPRWHPLRKVGSLLNSRTCHRFVSKVCQHELGARSAVIFASRYMPGDYNGPHDDGSLPRKVAFVLNMSRNWLVHWGGNLVILDKDYQNIVEAFTPRFNSLVLFDVPLPHAVLPVSLYSQSPRYALTGWFHGNGSPKRSR